MTDPEAVVHAREWLDIRALPGHFSNVLVEQLARHRVDRTMNTFAVLDEIGRMQRTWKGNSLGKPEQFKHVPLRGLWKQHFFEAQNLQQNLLNEIYSAESAKSLKKIADAINAGFDFSEGLDELMVGGYKRKAETGTLTGEWIVYAKDEAGENYFLTLAKHLECEKGSGESRIEWQQRSDGIIYQRVMACRSDFPNLVL